MTEITKKSSVTKDRTTSPFWGDWACEFNTGETMKKSITFMGKVSNTQFMWLSKLCFCYFAIFSKLELEVFKLLCWKMAQVIKQKEMALWLYVSMSFEPHSPFRASPPFNVLPPHRIPPCLDFAGLAQWAGTCTDTKQKPKRALNVLFTIYDPIPKS